VPSTITPRRATIALVGVVLAGSSLFLVGRLSWGDWKASSLVDVGRNYTTGAPLPAGLIVRQNIGFDGQFFYRLSLKPFTTTRAEFGLRFDQPARRQQRILYPFMVWILTAGGRAHAVPFALIAINLVAFGVVGWAGVALARKSGRSPPAGLLLAATPGLLIALGFDTGEVIAIALALVTLLLLRDGRFGWATSGSMLAALARETTLVIPIGVLVAVLWRRRQNRAYELGGRAVPLFTSLAPIIVYLGWQTLLWVRWGKPAFTSTDGSDLGLPFATLGRAVRLWSSRGQLVDHAFFLLAVVAVVALGIASLRQTAAPLHEKAAFLVAIGLASLYQWTVLAHYATFLRALSEVYILALLIVFGDHRRNVLPLGLVWIEVWGYLAVKARVIG